MKKIPREEVKRIKRKVGYESDIRGNEKDDEGEADRALKRLRINDETESV